MSLDERFMEDTAYGRAALRIFGDVPEDFRIYYAGWLGDWPNCHGMEVRGAVFRRASKGPRKGKLCIKVPGSDLTTYVSKSAIQADPEVAAEQAGK